MLTEQGKLYLLVAIDRTSKFAFVELHEKATRRVAGNFLRHLAAAVPYRIHTVLTDNPVALMNRDSGMSCGQAHIAGGRMSARCCRYMATVVAIRCNPAIRPFYKHLREQGKPPKVAIVAAMRKLIATANSMLAHDRPWRADPA